jgi:hypothetical protein
LEERKEKFTIQITETGVVIRSGEGGILRFTAAEALMLLDILQNEESKLKEVALEASPMAMRIRF